MSDLSPPDLPSDIAALLATERAAPGPGADVQARVLSRVEATLAAPPMAPPARAAGGAAKLGLAAVLIAGAALWAFWPRADHAVPQLPEMVVAAPVEAEPPTSLETTPATPRTPIQLAARAMETGEKRIVRAPVDSNAMSTRRQAADESAAPRATLASAPKRPAPNRRPVAVDIESERKILLEAKRALQRGAASSALSLFVKHARVFPRGLLTEEREAGRIQALAKLGRTASAQKRAVRFERRYPSSIHLRTIRQALK